VSAFDTDVGSWETLARDDPLWAVLSRDELHQGALTPEAEAMFWQSGEEHVGHVISVIRSEIDAGFWPGVSVDFGCGVGRNLVPLAAASRHAVGLDASPTMVERAQARLAMCGHANATVLVSGRAIDGSEVRRFGDVDFVHSVLVFQHIARVEGMALFDQLLDLLVPGGFGFAHFFCQGPGGELERLVRSVRFGHPWFNRFTTRSHLPLLNRAVMLYEYDVLELLSHLAAHQICDLVVERVDAGSSGYHARLYFRKDARSEEAYATAGWPMKVRFRP
jgi:predicted O-methyltransferase YrrM